jgi:sulfoxide reductase heme-binding subunit YedZ
MDTAQAPHHTAPPCAGTPAAASRRSRSNRLLGPGLVKPALFLMCPLPAACLFWAAIFDQLGTNPGQAPIRPLGDWTLRFLVIVLAVTL